MDGIGRRGLLRSAAALAAGGAAGCTPRETSASAAATGDTVVAVDAGRRAGGVSPYMTGVNGAKWYHDGYGIWDAEGDRPDPTAVERVRQSGIGLIRYPGGTSSNLFDWKGAVGPRARRSRQIEGRHGAPVDSRYGPDEYMRFVKAAGVTPQIMAPFVGSTPEKTAEWVSYMNAPRGTRGGDLRAENGHTEPYGVRYWEIGNELFGRHQRYWLSADDESAMAQYAFGGTQRQKRQHLGKPDDHRPSAAVSSGEPHQSFTVLYPPVVPRSQTVRVGDTVWHECADLASAGPHDRAYTFEPAEGTVRFGDGTHGMVPHKGLKVTADYESGPHAGFVDYYAKMKAADPHIEVLAIWAPVAKGRLTGAKSFPALMAEHGHADDYDGMTMHPYTDFSRDLGVTSFPDRRAGHDYQMLGDAAAGRAVAGLRAEMRKHGKDDPAVAVSEAGALFFGGKRDAKAYPEYSFAMSHALYMASQWVRFTALGVPWAAGNDLIGEKPGVSRTVFGAGPDFARTPDAIVREQLRDFFHGGGHLVRSAVRANVAVSTRSTPLGSSYDALVAAATIDGDGALQVLVVNRSPEDGVEAHVEPAGFRHSATVDVSVVAGRSYHDVGSPRHPDAVRIDRSRARVHGAALKWKFAAHSVTLLRFRPAPGAAGSR